MYNHVLFISWSLILYLTITELYKNNGDYRSVYGAVFPLFSKVQTVAIFETIHVMIGLVRARLGPTVAQLTSRLFLTWGVCYQIPQISQHWSFTSMIVIWSVAEIVRFGYHIRPRGLIKWIRYNAFIVLFPCGFFSEMMLAYTCAKKVKETHFCLHLGIMFISLFAYGPGFPFLYAHMFKQRAKYLKGSK